MLKALNNEPGHYKIVLALYWSRSYVQMPTISLLTFCVAPCSAFFVPRTLHALRILLDCVLDCRADQSSNNDCFHLSADVIFHVQKHSESYELTSCRNWLANFFVPSKNKDFPAILRFWSFCSRFGWRRVFEVQVGFAGPKFDGEFESSFGSAGSGRDSWLRVTMHTRCRICKPWFLGATSNMKSTSKFESYMGF